MQTLGAPAVPDLEAVLAIDQAARAAASALASARAA